MNYKRTLTCYTKIILVQDLSLFVLRLYLVQLKSNVAKIYITKIGFKNFGQRNFFVFFFCFIESTNSTRQD